MDVPLQRAAPPEGESFLVDLEVSLPQASRFVNLDPGRITNDDYMHRTIAV